MKKKKILFLGETYRQDAIIWINGLKEFGHFEIINVKKLIVNLQKGDLKMTPYIMPLFMMHIWIKNYIDKFSTVSAIIK